MSRDRKGVGYRVRAQIVSAPAMVLLAAAILTLCMPTALAARQMATEPPAPSAAPLASLPDHKIVPGDLLSISVFDEPELSKAVRVDDDGTITMPIVTKKLQAAGLLPRDIEADVSHELVAEQILLHPAVTVSIVEYAQRIVTVTGDVRTPGQFKIAGPITLLEALAKAGWITADAAPELLLTTPDAGMPRRIGIAQLLQNPGPSVNVTLTGGELIDVPDARKQLSARFPDGPKVWITGNVKSPLAYSIADPAAATVSKAVASAEGVTQNFAKTVYIFRRDDTGNRRGIPVPLNDIMHHKAQDVTLQSDDVLLIPDDNAKKMQQYYDTHPPTPPWEIAK